MCHVVGYVNERGKHIFDTYVSGAVSCSVLKVEILVTFLFILFPFLYILWLSYTAFLI